jgi:hypothetical protein
MDPLSLSRGLNLGMVLYFARRDDDAIRELRALKALQAHDLVCDAERVAELTSRARKSYVPPAAFVAAYTGVGGRRARVRRTRAGV